MEILAILPLLNSPKYIVVAHVIHRPRLDLPERSRPRNPASKLMDEQSLQLKEQEQSKVVAMETEELDADDILSEMYKEMSDILQEMIPKWKELGVQLRLSYGTLNTIEQNATQKANETCALKMLEKWRVQCGDAATPDKLITAVDKCGEKRYAKQLQKAVDGRTFDKDYTDDRIARDIAPYWDNVGIHLGVRRLRSIKDNNNPTDEKFKGVLREWLKQGDSQDEVYKKFHEALKGVQLIATAEKFYKIFLEPKNAQESDDDDNIPYDMN